MSILLLLNANFNLVSQYYIWSAEGYQPELLKSTKALCLNMLINLSFIEFVSLFLSSFPVCEKYAHFKKLF